MAYSANKILVPVFYALDNTRYPVIASFLAVLANILIINLTITLFQHLAIALSTSCTMLLNFIFLSTVLYRKMKGYPLRALFTGVFKILVATFCMSLLLLAARKMLAGFLIGSLIQQLVAVLLLIVLAAGLYTVVLHWLKLPELTEIVSKFRAKFARA
jgi:putative peptidoglycan lipid II flippase